MQQYIHRFGTPLTLAFVLAAVACSSDKPKDALSQDSTLSRDLALANKDSAAQPQLKDVPASAAAPAPVQPAPEKKAAPRPRPAAPRPKAPAATPTPTPPAVEAPVTTPSGNTVTKGAGGEKVGTIAAGTTVALRSAARVCTNTHKVGDRFTATVAEPVAGTNGAAIPAGATAVIEITKLKRSENANDNIVMGFTVVSITSDGRSYAVNSSDVTANVEKVRNSSSGNDAKKVAGGAVIGAIAGQILGKSTKSTVIGAAAGAAAGTAAAVATANFEGCIGDGSRITFRLDEPVTVRAN
jgi:hypothetical protein